MRRWPNGATPASRWGLKALSEEELATDEALRLYVVVQEPTWSAVAVLVTNQAVGNERLVESRPRVVAEIVGQSQTLRRIWSPLANELTDHGLGELARAIVGHLDAGQVQA